MSGNGLRLLAEPCTTMAGQLVPAFIASGLLDFEIERACYGGKILHLNSILNQPYLLLSE